MLCLAGQSRISSQLPGPSSCADQQVKPLKAIHALVSVPDARPTCTAAAHPPASPLTGLQACAPSSGGVRVYLWVGTEAMVQDLGQVT